MNKVLAMSILGMGLAGAVLIVSVALLFKSPAENVVQMVAAASTVAYAVFAVAALVLRKRFEDKGE
ncbi:MULTISPECIES: hypothetical protein [unclassified Lysinibacillus]|uniref:hypothetical protein n=1 Tax=unclassified Lysinibacillus TaxID=2636778 RepID=UPI0020130008|nr:MULTISPECIES: hypothetical protein [unclassified Lysinibacillus]MCL1696715.1 hypothetical protein [Lysinibacillus sp. BPa_S21]MCL1698799.1 hypothetical protein [Lysinibacillus sp. Bpr_S20]